MSTSIQVSNLSKFYRLGLIGGGTLHGDLSRWWALRRGRPDPLLRIGEADHGNRKNDYLWALRDVSFDVHEGEVMGIIGGNGAGKSTLLKILSSITAPTSGFVNLRGHVASLLEVGTGFHPELTGRENIILNGAILGMRRKEIQRKMDEIVAFAGVEQFIDTPVKRYSSGMFVRLAFAVAAHLEPEILLVDEVLAVGDLQFQRKCLGKMSEVAAQGRTILFVSHNMAAVLRLCSTGLLLERGEVAYSGSAAEAVRRYVESSCTELGTQELAWEAGDGHAPFRDVLRVQSYQVTDDAGKIAARRLYSSREYTARISFELITTSAAIIFMLAYYDAESRELLFVSDVYDCSDIDFGAIQPGFYHLAARLPIELLSNRTYEIELLCALHHTGWILPPDNASRLSFEVFRDNDTNQYAQMSRLGLLAPRIAWSLHAEGSDACEP